jgi:anaphase-promoting complex subunit 2
VGGKPYNIDEEIKNLELLKAKFGDNYLQNCQIIVKDIKDSKRINNNIHKTYDKEFETMDIEISKKKGLSNAPEKPFLRFDKLNAIFLSKGYWPINYDYESFKMPQNLQAIFDQYSSKYSMTKAMRKLIWHHSLGWVDLELEFDNGSFPFKCLPTHAILISYFDEKCKQNLHVIYILDLNTSKNSGMSLKELATHVGMSESMVRQLMSFWVHKGVVQEKKNQGNSITRKSLQTLAYFTTGEQQDLSTLYYVPVKIYEGTQGESNS